MLRTRGCVGGSGQIWATSDAGATWAQQSSGTSSSLSAVSFPDASHGWAVGSTGTIIATDDGGAHWSSQDSSTTEDLLGVSFADTAHGVAVGYGGTVLSTTDSGKTWVERFSGTTEKLYAVSCPDADHGWVAGGGILATTDGGLTWSAQIDHAPYQMYGVSAVDPDHCWAAGDGATILALDRAAPDVTPPSGSFSINAGATSTARVHVSADCEITDAHGPVLLRSSTDCKATWSSWLPFASSVPLTLPAGSGLKTVYVQCEDGAGNVAELTDSIELISAGPTVSATGATDGAWLRQGVTVELKAAAATGGPVVASITYALDGSSTTVTGAVAQVEVSGAPDGIRVLTYHAIDDEGIESGECQLTLHIDAQGPVAAAKATSGRRGRAIVLRYKIADLLSPRAKAIRIVVKNSHGTTVKTIRPTTKATATWYSVKWTPKARGTFRYYVYAKDLAGNAQRIKGSAKVVVR